jgi:hypothetical protein
MLVGVAGTPLGGGSASYVAASYVATFRYCSRGLVPLLDSQSRLYQSFWLPQELLPRMIASCGLELENEDKVELIALFSWGDVTMLVIEAAVGGELLLDASDKDCGH